EQEQEIAETDEALHRAVERGEIERIERRVHHQQRDQQDQRQGHQEGDHRLAPHGAAQAEAALARPPRRELTYYRIRHGTLSSRSNCRSRPQPHGLRPRASALPHVRRNPSTSLSAQASVFSIGSPLKSAPVLL